MKLGQIIKKCSLAFEFIIRSSKDKREILHIELFQTFSHFTILSSESS